MGKSRTYHRSPQGALRGPRLCVGCKSRPFIYGDRCPDCAHELRQRHDQRRKRKRR